MRRTLITAVAVISLTGCSETRPEADPPAFRVGEVKIFGNTVTPDRFIRERVEIYPGQRFGAADLIKAEWALALAGFDVLVIARKPDGDSLFRDVEIHLRETPLTYLVFGERNAL